MILNRIKDALFGRKQPGAAAVSLPSMPQPEQRVRLEDVLPSTSPALAALFEILYRTRNIEYYEKARLIIDGFAQAFDGIDPLPIAIDLLMREPFLWIMHCQENSAGTRNLNHVFGEALEKAWEGASSRHGAGLPIDLDHLELLLDACAHIAARTDMYYHNNYSWLPISRVVESAAARAEPRARQALIAMLRSFFSGKTEPRYAAHLVGQLLKLTCIAPSEIPEVAEIERHTKRMLEVCNRVIAAADPLLTACVTAVLAGDYGINTADQREAEKHEALAALIKRSPVARGQAFHDLLILLADPQRFGITKWGALKLEYEHYSANGHHKEYLSGFINIVDALAQRKMVLVDADNDVAAFLRLLPESSLTHTRAFELVLETIQAYPQGAAIAELDLLRRLAEPPLLIRQNLFMIEEMLPPLDLTGQVWAQGTPTLQGRHANAGTNPPAKFDPAGFHSDQQEAIQAAQPYVLQGLQPISLPEFKISRSDEKDNIHLHFDNLFEARLYDQLHLEFLAQLASIYTQLSGHTPADPDDHAKAYEAALAAGFSRDLLHDIPYKSIDLVGSIAMGAALHSRFKAFEPFVHKYPHAMRTLMALACAQAVTKKWLEKGRDALDGIAQEDRLAMLDVVFANAALNQSSIYTLILLSRYIDPQLVGPRLAEFALKQCYVTQPGVGIRFEKLGNFCVQTLAAMPEGAGIVYLARILARTKYPKIRNRVEGILNEAATKAGMSRSTLDELTVPTHALDRDGKRSITLADGEAMLRVVGNDVKIDWFGPGGKPLKAPSVAMKAHKAELLEIRNAAKELAADLSIQPQRLQRQYLEACAWPAEIWCARYLDHPLMRTLVRRLLWWVEGSDGQRVSALPDPAGDVLCDVTGTRVLLEGATIRPWHLIDDTAEQIDAWRDRLEALEITQPFAQAWREIYVLTEAERATDTYSNRWAAHILRQHQAMTLARINGWHVTHRMWVNCPNDQPWHLMIREHGLLEHIVPRLKIAAKLSFEERYLYVQGTRHVYRIHLGSGACFHGERHICIIRNPEATKERIWLPFEGDQTLSIILSRAFLI